MNLFDSLPKMISLRILIPQNILSFAAWVESPPSLHDIDYSFMNKHSFLPPIYRFITTRYGLILKKIFTERLQCGIIKIQE